MLQQNLGNGQAAMMAPIKVAVASLIRYAVFAMALSVNESFGPLRHQAIQQHDGRGLATRSLNRRRPWPPAFEALEKAAKRLVDELRGIQDLAIFSGITASLMLGQALLDLVDDL